MISKTMDCGLTGGLPASLISSIVNLQYADDALLFGLGNMKQTIVLKLILRCFEAWSGSRISFHLCYWEKKDIL